MKAGGGGGGSSQLVFSGEAFSFGLDRGASDGGTCRLAGAGACLTGTRPAVLLRWRLVSRGD